MPSDTFICTATNDSYGEYGGLTWPPASIQGGGDGATSIWCGINFSTPNYFSNNGYVRFDTSTLPDDATVTAANLLLHLVTANQANAGQILYADYYDFGGEPWGAADYSFLRENDAFQVSYDALGAVGSVKTIALSNLGSISKTGFTGIRIKNNNAVAPTGNNNLLFASTEDATLQEPRLVVDYDLVPTFRFDSSLFPKPKLRSAVPVRW